MVEMQAAVDSTFDRTTSSERTRKERGDDSAVVALVGDSMAGGAFLPPLAMAALLEQSSGQPNWFLRLTGAGWEMVALEERIDDLLAYEPAVVILQANMLFLKSTAIGAARRTRPRDARWSLALADQVAEGLARLSLRGPGSQEPEIGGLPLAIDNGDLYLDAALDRWSVRVATPDDPNLALAEELVARATKQGARVAIIVLPVSRHVQRAAPGFLADRYQYAEQLAGRYGALFLPSDPTWPDELFQDAAHLNASGKERYSAWIAPYLAELLAAPEQP
jgi:hypothetical protein